MIKGPASVWPPDHLDPGDKSCSCKFAYTPADNWDLIKHITNTAQPRKHLSRSRARPGKGPMICLGLRGHQRLPTLLVCTGSWTSIGFLTLNLYRNVHLSANAAAKFAYSTEARRLVLVQLSPKGHFWPLSVDGRRVVHFALLWARRSKLNKRIINPGNWLWNVHRSKVNWSKYWRMRRFVFKPIRTVCASKWVHKVPVSVSDHVVRKGCRRTIAIFDGKESNNFELFTAEPHQQ